MRSSRPAQGRSKNGHLRQIEDFCQAFHSSYMFFDLLKSSTKFLAEHSGLELSTGSSRFQKMGHFGWTCPISEGIISEKWHKWHSRRLKRACTIFTGTERQAKLDLPLALRHVS